MSFSVIVEGVTPPNAKWKKMKAAWDACEAAGVNPPKEVSEFFGDNDPDPDGVVHELASGRNGCEWSSSHEAAEASESEEAGVLIELSKLPKGVTKIRVAAR